MTIDMTQNRVPYDLLTDEEKAALTVEAKMSYDYDCDPGYCQASALYARIEALAKERDERIEAEQVQKLIELAEPILAEAYAAEYSRAEAAEAALKDAYFAGWADGSDTTSVTGDPTPDWEAYKHGSQK